MASRLGEDARAVLSSTMINNKLLCLDTSPLLISLILIRESSVHFVDIDVERMKRRRRKKREGERERISVRLIAATCSSIICYYTAKHHAYGTSSFVHFYWLIIEIADV